MIISHRRGNIWKDTRNRRTRELSKTSPYRHHGHGQATATQPRFVLDPSTEESRTRHALDQKHLPPTTRECYRTSTVISLWWTWTTCIYICTTTLSLRVGPVSNMCFEVVVLWSVDRNTQVRFSRHALYCHVEITSAEIFF
jgi:hypothetical protein